MNIASKGGTVKNRDSSQTPRGEIPVEAKQGRGGPRKTQDQTATPNEPRGRGRPIGSKTKPKRPSLYNNISRESRDNIHSIDLVIPEVIESKDEINIKDQMTQKELNFLELLFSGNHSIDKAMILAGYGQYSKDWRYKLSQKIIRKYEQQVGDHRKIMRTMGYGEVKVIKLLIDSAENAKSETVKLNARIALAKCIGLQKEVVDGVEGITIVFNAHASPPDQPSTATQPKPVAPPASTPTPGFRVIK